jgi:hypothetical protein
MKYMSYASKQGTPNAMNPHRKMSQERNPNNFIVTPENPGSTEIMRASPMSLIDGWEMTPELREHPVDLGKQDVTRKGAVE